MNQAEQLVNGLIADVNLWRSMLALVLKQSGGTITVKKRDTEVEGEFEIVMRRIDESANPDDTELEIRLLEGKEEIESVMGKPSPIVVPR